ncbi:hypothetical protein BH23BAC1_BH23BAC1_02930 [soil metagenome]
MIYSFEVKALVNDLPDNFTVIKDLENDLLIFDDKQNIYQPYLKNTSGTFPTLSYLLDLKSFSGYKIMNCFPRGSSIFIDKKIVFFSREAGCTQLNIDSLRIKYRKDSLLITIFNPNKQFKEVSVKIVSEKSLQQKNDNDKSSLAVVPREFSDYNDFFIVGILVLMILLAIIYNRNPKHFLEFYNLQKAVSFKIRAENYISVKYISSSYLLFLMLHSLIVGFILLTIIHFYHSFGNFFQFIDTSDFWSSFLSWMKISLIIFSSLIIKYLIVTAIAQLFNLRGFYIIHFFDFVRMSLIFFLLILITIGIFLFAFAFEEQFWFQPLMYIIGGFFIIRMFILFLKLYKYAPFRNLHLFLYICSTELLPILVGFKIFINY